ncbi:MAG: hypothetical protein Q9172_006234 [Xanthocarpia lactea]
MSSFLSLLLLAVVALFVYRFLIYPPFVSPLSKIPAAHFTASWSPLWILWIRYTHVEVQTIHKAHLRLGPIVRLGPSEVSVNCVDGGLRTVYAGGFGKPYFYDQFQNYGYVLPYGISSTSLMIDRIPNMFSTKESTPHAARKRLVSNVYSKSFIQSSPEAQELTRAILHERLLPSLDSFAAEGSSLEVLELNYAVTMDFASSYLFGLSNDSNFIQDVKMRRRFLAWFFKRSEHFFWNQEIPRLTRLLRRIGVRLVPKWVDAANDEIQAWVLQLCRLADQSIKAASESTEKADGTRPVVYGQLSDSLRRSPIKPEARMDSGSAENYELPIASEMFDHVVAGMDTSGITLTYLLWEMSRDPELQASLRKELYTLSPSLAIGNESEVPSARSVEALPLLHAVVMETLRRHCPIPGSQPRLTPSKPTSLAGSPPLPGGVRVSAQAYSLHRNEQVFPDPEAWNPQRWLDADQEQKDEMMRWFWAFGSGGRMCVGKNFATQELKYVTAAVYSNFTTSIVNDAGIEQADGYTAGPTGNQLTLKFVRASPR